MKTNEQTELLLRMNVKEALQVLHRCCMHLWMDLSRRTAIVYIVEPMISDQNAVRILGQPEYTIYMQSYTIGSSLRLLGGGAVGSFYGFVGCLLGSVSW
jgi:hypothetical protein